ncbi:hypothetical protein CABS01_08164 [Colletotrichum abscissum]|nr:uncharacterized protein CABS01_08164 [Colletotrichum abscissum]KAK1508934.1 hypothetical protein CABS01_08164 [Colletotrichum abscissum]
MAQFVQVVYLSGHLHLPETLSSLAVASASVRNLHLAWKW